MAIVSVDELYPRAAGLTNTRLATYQRTFRVITDTAHDGPIAVRAGLGTVSGITLFSPYSNGLSGTSTRAATESDATSYVQNVGCQCVAGDLDDGKEWIVAVDYGPFDPAQNADNPLAVPPDVSWDDATWEEICDQDVAGNSILNTAGDPFDPPITRDASRPILRITRNEPLFLIANAYTWRNRINSDTFMGAAAGIAKCRPIKATRQFHPTAGYFWQVNYEFEFNPEGWVKTVLNQGLRQLVTTGTGGSATYSRSAIRIGGELATAPVPLDSTGAQLPPNGTPHYLTFDVYESVPFAPLNLDPGGAIAAGDPRNFGGATDFSGVGFTANGAPVGGIPAAPAESGGTEG